jgi:mono/diheme cytochrome c family protein
MAAITRGFVFGVLFPVAAAVLPTNALAAEARQGEVLAKRWCASCHVVAADQKSGGTQAPAFSAIAATSGLDAAKLALFLLVPHPKMPDMNLSRAEAADIAAYIMTQRK